MTSYSFTTSFVIRATGEEVWKVLLDFPQWKSWWKGVRNMAVSNHTHPPTLHVRIGFPMYSLNLRLQVEHIEIGKKIHLVTKGDLIGDGIFTLHEHDHGTKVRFDWNVATTKTWMNIVALFAKPIFEFSHTLVMKWFVHGLSHKLHTSVTNVHHFVNPSPVLHRTVVPVLEK